VSPERDDYLDDELEAPEPTRGGVLAAGWLRALLVLGGLAILLVVTVPYIIEWIAPSQPLPRPIARTAPTEAPAPAATTSSAITPAPATVTPAPAPEPAPAAPAPAKAASEPKPQPAAKSEPAPKAEPAPAKSAVKPAAVARATEPAAAKSTPAAPKASAAASKATPKATAAAVKPSGSPTAATGGYYWVQVGLFARSDNAERLARELRDERFNVEIAQTTRGGGAAAPPATQHEVIVTGSTVDVVTAALKGTGTAEAGEGMVLVRPAMDLKDAVTLSRRLAGEGFQVRIRRVATAPAEGTLFLVRVGGYPTRDAAAAGKRELAAKGVGGFVTQGAAK
jgi:cell division septation protein DedD